MDQGLLTGAVFIDLRKAFDSVDHDLLINKLESHGLKTTELNWFKTYLSDRKKKLKELPLGYKGFSLTCLLLLLLLLLLLQNCFQTNF